MTNARRTSELDRSSANAPPETSAPEPRETVAALASGWPGVALAIDAAGVILSASPLSGFAEGMKAPFDASEGPSVRKDAGGREWRLSAPSHGVRLAIGDASPKVDAANRFTASVSHEIRTPLNGILGMASLLEESPLSPSQSEYVAAIRKSGARLLDLLNNVLDYSRMEAGELPLEHTAFDPADLVQDVAELLSPRAHAAGVDLAAMTSNDLPSRMMGDAGRLRQILFNLVGNAIKFTEKGGVLIEAAPGPDGEGLSLIVRDTGMGIPEEARDRLFEAFGQARAADAGRDGGVGLGLAIVARLVAAMKGSVTVRSVEGGGAMFRVDLPLFPARPGARTPPAACIGKPNGRTPVIAMDLPPATALASAAALDPCVKAVDASIEGVAGADLAIIDGARPLADIEAVARSRPTLVVLRPEDRPRMAQLSALGCAGYLIRPLRASSLIERTRLALTGAMAPDNDDFAEPSPAAGGRILIAEDNSVNALLASRALTAGGFRVDIVSNGAEALERAAETVYSTIFMDIRMPVMDGLEATRRIRRLGGDVWRTPIIALTADIDPDLEARAKAAGVNALASKPIDPQKLRELAETWSRRKRSAAE